MSQGRKSLRQTCIGGCGRQVLVKLGAECRKCRRKRILIGKRRIHKIEQAQRVAERTKRA